MTIILKQKKIMQK